MSDPLSMAASIVGIISLGIQVTQILFNHYKDMQAENTDAAQMAQKLRSLSLVLHNLYRYLHRPRDGFLLREIEAIVKRCKKDIQKLKRRAGKFGRPPETSNRSTIRTAGRRIAYPFRKNTLKATIDKLIARFSLALLVLQQPNAAGHRATQADGPFLKILKWLKAPDARSNLIKPPK
ncbi:hypothetical protein F4802DRAFT_213140 [Xylaria palmicola]|nr:hypothetical protein F4802DRAFT_213140 [Xylaria palmicola]